VFEQVGALDQLEGFASEHGPRFYGLPLNTDQVTLERSSQHIPERLSVPASTPAEASDESPLTADEAPVLFHAGETLPWRVVVDG